MKPLEIGILYLSFYNSLVNVYGNNAIVHRKVILTKLGRQFMVDRKLRPIAIKEMINRGLIKKINKNKYELLSLEIDLEKDVHKLYQLCGIY